MTSENTLTQNFDLLGSAADTETAMVPLAFKGRRYVRLIQFWGENHHFWYDLQTFNEADWQELKENLNA